MPISAATSTPEARLTLSRSIISNCSLVWILAMTLHYVHMAIHVKRNFQIFFRPGATSNSARLRAFPATHAEGARALETVAAHTCVVYRDAASASASAPARKAPNSTWKSTYYSAHARAPYPHRIDQVRGKSRPSGRERIARTAAPSYNGVAADNQGSLRQGMPEVTPVEIRAAVAHSAQEPTEATHSGSMSG